MAISGNYRKTMDEIRLNPEVVDRLWHTITLEGSAWRRVRQDVFFSIFA
jgi:hypothetical protein